LLFGNGANPKRSKLPQYIPDDEEFARLVRFSEYNSAYESAIVALDNGRITLEEMHETMIGLQNNINVVLGRDPNSIAPPSAYEINKLAFDPVTHTREFITPDNGPISIARAEIQATGAEISRERQTRADEKVVFRQRTTGRKKKKK
jgi:hypothetical protein